MDVGYLSYAAVAPNAPSTAIKINSVTIYSLQTISVVYKKKSSIDIDRSVQIDLENSFFFSLDSWFLGKVKLWFPTIKKLGPNWINTWILLYFEKMHPKSGIFSSSDGRRALLAEIESCTGSTVGVGQLD